MIKIEKIRLQIHPSRFRHADKGCEGTCPLALAAIGKMGFTRVSVNWRNIVGYSPALGFVQLNPISRNKHNSFIDAVDTGKIDYNRRYSFTYTVNPISSKEARTRLSNSRRLDEKEKKHCATRGISTKVTQ
jgi:hypothetical protein